MGIMPWSGLFLYASFLCFLSSMIQRAVFSYPPHLEDAVFNPLCLRDHELSSLEQWAEMPSFPMLFCWPLCHTPAQIIRISSSVSFLNRRVTWTQTESNCLQNHTTKFLSSQADDRHLTRIAAKVRSLYLNPLTPKFTTLPINQDCLLISKRSYC